MTLNGAIMQLVEMRENSMMPSFFKPYLDKVIKTVSECDEPSHEKSAQQWIPCKTRLPEELEEVNVTWINHCPESYYDFVKGKPFTGSAVYYKEKWYWYSSTCTDILSEYGENDIDEVDDAIEIIAWKPIGEPWKGEQE